MEILKNAIETIRNFGITEWSLTITCFIELIALLAYNKGLLICKNTIERNEDEIKQYKLVIDALQNSSEAD